MSKEYSTPGSTSSEGTTSKQSPLRQNILRYLTKLSHGSTPFITTFLLIHLSAPALANLGGSSLSSQTMLLGREYYQTSFGEKYLLLAPLAAHSLSGLTKRLLSTRPISAPRCQTPARPLSSLLSWTGYAIALVFLPIHFITHRLNPTSIGEPISEVGPAELDYEFVKLGLQKWPVRSWLLYTGLVFSVALHTADGVPVIWNMWFRNAGAAAWNRDERSDVRQPRYRKIVTIIGGSMISVLAGLYVISKEPPMIFSSMAKRFEAVFTKSFVYRI